MPGSIWDMRKMNPFDLTGILVSRTKFVGFVDNYPTRRRIVPYEPIDLYAGNDRDLRVYVKTPELDIVDLTGATAKFSVAVQKGQTPVLTKTGVIGAADKGEIIFSLVPSDTSDLDIRQYAYNVEIATNDSKVYTVLEGVVNLLATVS